MSSPFVKLLLLFDYQILQRQLVHNLPAGIAQILPGAQHGHKVSSICPGKTIMYKEHQYQVYVISRLYIGLAVRLHMFSIIAYFHSCSTCSISAWKSHIKKLAEQIAYLVYVHVYVCTCICMYMYM